VIDPCESAQKSFDSVEDHPGTNQKKISTFATQWPPCRGSFSLVYTMMAATMAPLKPFSLKECVLMEKVARLRVGPFVLLMLLVLLALLAVHRRGLKSQEAEGVVANLDDTERDQYKAVAVLGLVALFAFVTWIAFSANRREDKAVPSAEAPSASDKTMVH
jgi:hypothetical protein